MLRTVVVSFVSFLSASALAQQGPRALPTDIASDPVASGSNANSPSDGAGNPADALFGVGEYSGGRFILWESADGEAFIKPTLMISAGLVHYRPENEANEDLANRTSTLINSRFGFEGKLNKYVSFKSQFERNVGYSIARDGPVGTSVWEGTAALQARENYVRLSNWGLSLTAGIVADPASLDFVSIHLLDMFGMDPFIRDPLLVTGFNQAQGLLAQYEYEIQDVGKLTAGLIFQGGNPLTSTLSFGFGGNVSANGTLFTAPLRAIANGIPGSNIHLYTFSPSLMFDSEFFDLRGAVQVYDVDISVRSEDDVGLSGINYRTTARLKPFARIKSLESLALIGGYAYRTNEQVDITDLSTRLDDDYEATTWNIGFDVNYGDFGLGVGYYDITQTFNEETETDLQYVNVAGSYWLDSGFLAVGARYAQQLIDLNSDATSGTDAQSFHMTVRLVI